jgi:hypothetical protein
VPTTGLMEMSLPRRSRIWQVVKVLTPDRCLGKSKISQINGLITRFFGHPAGGTEDAGNHRPRPCRRAVMSLPAGLKEGSVPEDGG